jgi:DNA-binding MarR family transcriptional regulator
MRRDALLPLIRELACSYRALSHVAARHLRTLGLTAPQFDIVATLGDSLGLSCQELGARTLITKGTLTGVVDRLARRGLVRRRDCPVDRRRRVVALTPAGHRLFARVFPAHVAYLRGACGGRSAADLERLRVELAALRAVLERSAQP